MNSVTGRNIIILDICQFYFDKFLASEVLKFRIIFLIRNGYRQLDKVGSVYNFRFGYRFGYITIYVLIQQ